MVKNKSLSSRKLLFPYIETTFTYIGTTKHEPNFAAILIEIPIEYEEQIRG